MLRFRGNTSNRIVPDISSLGGGGGDSMTNSSTTPTWHPSPAERNMTKRKNIIKDLVATIHNNTPRSPRRILKSIRVVGGINHKATGNTLELQADRNLTQFLTIDCPTDVLPKILAYAGPISAAALQQTSRHFRDVLNTEGTWRGLCEELYKVGSTNYRLYMDQTRLFIHLFCSLCVCVCFLNPFCI